MIKTRMLITMKRGDDTIEITRTIEGNNVIDITDSIQELVLDTVPGCRLMSIYFMEERDAVGSGGSKCPS